VLPKKIKTPLCPEGAGSIGDADPGSDPPLCSKDGGNSGDADPGSDLPLCPEDGGSIGDVDSGSDPPLCSKDGGNSGDADPVGEVEGRIEGKVAGLSRHPFKMMKRGIMSGSVRSGPSSPGRAILSQDAVFSVDALCKCGKPRLGRWSY
jgi:hypothetical protein